MCRADSVKVKVRKTTTALIMKKTISLLPLIFFAGCAAQVDTSTPHVPPHSPHIEVIEVPNEQIEQAKEVLLAKLKDPYSAVIEDIYAVRINKREESVSYCGLVNAKNSYGGYTGVKPFRISSTGNVYLWDKRGAAFNKGITPYCPSFKAK